MSQKIFKHICISFIKSLILFHIGVAFIIFLADFTENIRSSTNIEASKLIIISLIKIPDFITQISPFILLLASFATIRNMVLKKEVDIFKSFGISIWQFLIPFVFVSFIWSIIIITVISPFAVEMLILKEKLSNNVSLTSQKTTISTDNYIWIVDKHGNSSNIIATKKLTVNDDETELSPVIFLEINKNIFQGAIFANKALMEESKITFYDTTSKYKKDFYPEKKEKIEKNSFLSSDNLTSLTNEPFMIKIWDFPKVIAGLKSISFASQEYEIYFYNLLTLPILFIAMIMISTRFSLYDIRAGKNLFAIFSCISVGFFVYFFINFANVALITFNISPLISVLSAKIIVFLIAVNLLFAKEGL